MTVGSCRNHPMVKGPYKFNQDGMKPEGCLFLEPKGITIPFWESR